MDIGEIEVLCEDRFLCGEGPLWQAKTQELYWTNSEGKSIRCYSEKIKKWNNITRDIHASSLALHKDGGLVFGSKTGFYHLDKNMEVRALADKFEDKPINNINDIIVDFKGRVYGGQECFTPDEKYETGYLYKVDIDGSVSVIEEGLHISNGMGFSPDSKLFYLVDTIVRNIYVYDFDFITGSISNKRVFVTLSKNDGLPDGLTVDSEGYIWVARFLGSGITRYDPDGKIERKIELPCAQPTSLTFGGKDFNHIYITTAGMYWETNLAPDFHDYDRHRGGELLRIKQDIIGRQEYLAKIKI